MVIARPQQPPRSHRARRSGERGAAMFIVLMVVMILSAIGTFALSNARFEVQASGFTRQHAIAQEVTTLGALAAMTEVSGAPAAYLTRMRNAALTGERCKSNMGLAIMPPPPCFNIYLLDIEHRTGTTTERIFRPPTATAPGSLGMDKLNGGFWVELTEPLDVIRPVAGAPIDGSPGTPKFLDVTLTSTGVLFVDADGNGKIDWAAGEGQGAVFTSGRGHVVVGPIYGPI